MKDKSSECIRVNQRLIITFFVLFCTFSLLNSTIINIPADQPTIQEGINESANGDTILVQPGTYYENITYNGKSITVASLEMTTGDESYIASTIINGNQTGSCVIISDEASNAILQGFSITNGSGSHYYQYIRGGGILINNYATAHIVNCNIFDNNANSGGGITIIIADVYLEGTRITNNNAFRGGGGIYTSHESGVYFSEENRCNIYGNNAAYGLDICAIEEFHQANEIHVVLDTFSVSEPQYYFANHNLDENPFTFDILYGYIEPVNHDLYVSPTGDDNNSGLTPDEPLQRINTALFRIYPDSLDPKTIHIAGGTYSRSGNDQILPISAKKNVDIIGENMESTIIDAESNGSILGFSFEHNDIAVKNITFQNAFGTTAVHVEINDDVLFENVTIQDCISEKWTAFMATKFNNLLFKNVKIVGNIADEGWAGMYIENGLNVKFDNCLFENNFSNGTNGFVYNALYVHADGELRMNNCAFRDNIDYTNGGVGVFLFSRYYNDEVDVKINNCLIENNYSANGERLCGAGAREGSADITNCTFVGNLGEFSTLSLYGNTKLANNIFHNETIYEIYLPNLISGGTHTTVDVSHCNIQDGIAGIYNEDDVNTVNWLEGNISSDPQFIGAGNYQLAANSPCIDAGIQDTTGLFIPPWDLLNNHRVWDGDNDGNATIDMGCYEHGSEEYLGIEDTEIIIPTKIEMNNYPNPFNPSTTISFSLTHSGQVELVVYNIKGQKVKTLIDCYMSPGRNDAIWSGRDNDNRQAASGTYFVKLSVDGVEKSVQKMLLLK